jgi:ABC-type glutathione transport system ATPase component
MTRSASVTPSDRSQPDANPPPLLETRGLTKHFKVGGNLSRKVLHAVDDVSIVINRTEIVALVGERAAVGKVRSPACWLGSTSRPVATSSIRDGPCSR